MSGSIAISYRSLNPNTLLNERMFGEASVHYVERVAENAEGLTTIYEGLFDYLPPERSQVKSQRKLIPSAPNTKRLTTHKRAAEN